MVGRSGREGGGLGSEPATLLRGAPNGVPAVARWFEKGRAEDWCWLSAWSPCTKCVIPGLGAAGGWEGKEEEEREREGRGGGGRDWERTGNVGRGAVPRERLEDGRREAVCEGGAGSGREGEREEEAEGGVLAICGVRTDGVC